MEILKFPHPALLKSCREVTVFGPELKIILDNMFETMVAAKGLGLSANQVGLDLYMFVMVDSNGKNLYLVNPIIKNSSKSIINQREGCLSAPGEFLITGNRASWVLVEFQDETGLRYSRLFNDILAVCVQHEIEHLRGEAFIQSKVLSQRKRREICKRWGLKD